MVALKCLSNFRRTLEMSRINGESNLVLNWAADGVIVSTAIANQGEHL